MSPPSFANSTWQIPRLNTPDGIFFLSDAIFFLSDGIFFSSDGIIFSPDGISYKNKR